MLRPPPSTTLFPYTTLFRSPPTRSLSRTSRSLSGRVDRYNARFFIPQDRKSTRLNSSHLGISYAVFCLKKKRVAPDDDVRGRAQVDNGAHADRSYDYQANYH